MIKEKTSTLKLFNNPGCFGFQFQFHDKWRTRSQDLEGCLNTKLSTRWQKRQCLTRSRFPGMELKISWISPSNTRTKEDPYYHQHVWPKCPKYFFPSFHCNITYIIQLKGCNTFDILLLSLTILCHFLLSCLCSKTIELCARAGSIFFSLYCYVWITYAVRLGCLFSWIHETSILVTNVLWFDKFREILCHWRYNYFYLLCSPSIFPVCTQCLSVFLWCFRYIKFIAYLNKERSIKLKVRVTVYHAFPHQFKKRSKVVSVA